MERTEMLIKFTINSGYLTDSKDKTISPTLFLFWQSEMLGLDLKASFSGKISLVKQSVC